MSDTLQHFNQIPASQAEALLLALCGSARWANALAARRPFTDAEHLQHAAGNLWFYLDEADWLEAFACHPRIGEHSAHTSLHSPFFDDAMTAVFEEHSASEQQRAQETLVQCAAALIQGNKDYEERFSFRYIVSASGHTAPELLALLQQRLHNDRRTELHEAARQQGVITALRIRKWLAL